MLTTAAIAATCLVVLGYVALKARRGLTRLEDHIVASAKRNPKRRRMVPQPAAGGGASGRRAEGVSGRIRVRCGRAQKRIREPRLGLGPRRRTIHERVEARDVAERVNDRTWMVRLRGPSQFSCAITYPAIGQSRRKTVSAVTPRASPCSPRPRPARTSRPLVPRSIPGSRDASCPCSAQRRANSFRPPESRRCRRRGCA